MIRTEARDFAAAGVSPAGSAEHALAVAARGLRHRYGDLLTLDGLELSVRGGSVLGLVGPSGCGKSTLLEILCGLREPSEGKVVVRGAREAADRLAGCAFMPQRDVLLPWLSALDNAALAPRNRGARRRAARAEAARLFERFGLAGFEGALPRELSGGMRQRVAFLRTGRLQARA